MGVQLVQATLRTYYLLVIAFLITLRLKNWCFMFDHLSLCLPIFFHYRYYDIEGVFVLNQRYGRKQNLGMSSIRNYMIHLLLSIAVLQLYTSSYNQSSTTPSKSMIDEEQDSEIFCQRINIYSLLASISLYVTHTTLSC